MPCPRRMIAVLCLLPAALAGAQDPVPADTDYDDPCRTAANGSLFKPLSDIKPILQSDGQRQPQDCSVAHFTSQLSGSESRFHGDIAFHWRPTNFFHMPAYFDDVPLERYGQSRRPCLQPVVSGAKFALQLPMTPYKIGIDRPHDCISTLGHRPPGDCVPEHSTTSAKRDRRGNHTRCLGSGARVLVALSEISRYGTRQEFRIGGLGKRAPCRKSWRLPLQGRKTAVDTPFQLEGIILR